MPPLPSLLLLALALAAVAAAGPPDEFPPCVALDSADTSLPVPLSRFYVNANVSYMNSATLGPMPRAALRCAVKVWEDFESDPLEKYPWSGGQELDQVRQKAADLLGADVDEMVLTPSTTVALNMVGEGLVSSKFLRPGARALTTDQEHGGGTAWLTHWQTAGVVGPIDKVAVPYGLGATAASVIAAFGEALQRAEAAGEKYSVVFASHVLTTTGVALPLVDIASLVHAHGAMFVVDGAQAPGGLSLDLHATGADVYTVSAHKWLLAPTGSGLLYLRAGRTQRAVLPTYLDGGYTAYSTSTGTLPLQTVAGLGYVLDMFAGLGMDRVAAHNLALREVLYSALTEMVASLVARDPALYAGLEIISPHAAGGVTSPIVALNLPPAVLLNTDACAALSADYGVVVKLMSDYEGGNDFVVNAIRMTTHVFNTREDVSKLMTGLSTLLGA